MIKQSRPLARAVFVFSVPTTTVDVGGGFWLKQLNGDKKIYVTVKNPVK